MAQERKQKTLTGTVTSISGKKSIRVQIDYKVKHPRYNKYIKRRTKVGVHDAQEVAAVGDLVEIVECRPLSKTITWRVVGVVNKALAV